MPFAIQIENKTARSLFAFSSKSVVPRALFHIWTGIMLARLLLGYTVIRNVRHTDCQMRNSWFHGFTLALSLPSLLLLLQYTARPESGACFAFARSFCSVGAIYRAYRLVVGLVGLELLIVYTLSLL